MPPRHTANTSVPIQCPFCSTAQVVYTGRMTENTFYRCQGCAKIWNPLQLVELATAESSKVEVRSAKSK